MVDGGLKNFRVKFSRLHPRLHKVVCVVLVIIFVTSVRESIDVVGVEKPATADKVGTHVT